MACTATIIDPRNKVLNSIRLPSFVVSIFYVILHRFLILLSYQVVGRFSGTEILLN